jgi:DNA mismatch endonuclease (patch repair protein)
MSPEKRSALMARIRGRDTGPEQAIATILAEKGVECERHSPDLPGRPDFVFRTAKVAVFVDGDFWHGWRFPTWRHKLSAQWEEKIDGNRRRDSRNFRRLRRGGWRVIRLWEHQIKNDSRACVEKVLATLPIDRRKSFRRKVNL